jgi:hypothetical protein
LSAFRFGDAIVLQFIRVLDIYDEVGGESEEEGAELVDRGYWGKKSTSTVILAACVQLD